jgi:hypothetical protein
MNGLYLLSGLPESKLQNGIEAKRVSPVLKIADARALVSKLTASHRTMKRPILAQPITPMLIWRLRSHVSLMCLEKELAKMPNQNSRHLLHQKLLAHLTINKRKANSLRPA